MPLSKPPVATLVLPERNKERVVEMFISWGLIRAAEWSESAECRRRTYVRDETLSWMCAGLKIDTCY